jgi:hypothetical protein
LFLNKRGEDAVTDQGNGSLIPRMESPVLSLRFDDEVRVLTHNNTSVFLFSDPYRELNHVVHQPNPKSPDVVVVFGRPRLVQRLRSEWFTTTITRYPADAVIDAYVQHSSRGIDQELRNLK